MKAAGVSIGGVNYVIPERIVHFATGRRAIWRPALTKRWTKAAEPVQDEGVMVEEMAPIGAIIIPFSRPHSLVHAADQIVDVLRGIVIAVAGRVFALAP